MFCCWCMWVCEKVDWIKKLWPSINMRFKCVCICLGLLSYFLLGAPVQSAYTIVSLWALSSFPLNPSFFCSSEQRLQEAWDSLRLNTALWMVLSSRQLISTTASAVKRYWVHVTVALYESLHIKCSISFPAYFRFFIYKIHQWLLLKANPPKALKQLYASCVSGFPDSFGPSGMGLTLDKRTHIHLIILLGY